MVKIVHMADTHLGYREGRGSINKWAIENYSRPYEQDIYDGFLKVMEDISKIKDLDFLVHSGDIFHLPFLKNSYPPQEPARRVLKKGLDIFFENTENQVPFIYIEGNHGIFRGYEYTPFESHINKLNYPQIYYYKERDLINAIKENKPLKLEFKEKRVRFYLFPYFEFKNVEAYKIAYNNWVNNQCPPSNDGYINIAVAHGSKADGTLHKKIRTDDFDYDYIALGHEHALKNESKKHYFAGCLLPMNFKERYENQGYLIVNIDEKSKDLEVKKVFTQYLLKRAFEIVEIDVSPQESSADLIEKINSKLDEHISEKGFDSKTSSRLKFNFIGEMTYEKNWQINDLMNKIRRDCFSQSDKYNILQLIWIISDISELIEDPISPGIIEDFVLEYPDEEFKNFVEEKLREDKSNFNVEKLTEFGMNAIRRALKIMDKEKEV